MRTAFALALLLGACAPQSPKPPSERFSEVPPYPPVDPVAARKYRTWQAANALPAVELHPTGAAPRLLGGTRIGGPAWLGRSEEWPKDRKGRRMTFLAQLDFASMPRIADYPETGVLQFFVAHDQTYGADSQRPERGDFRVIWRPAIKPGGRLVANVPHLDPVPGLRSPLERPTASTGVALRPRAVRSVPTFNNWMFVRDFAELYRRNGWGRLSALLGASPHHASERHHVGGHPEFVQDDWRTFRRDYREADRVLLNLWSDKSLMWGDMGQGQFLIARDDLLKRDFSRVWYQWDCS